ncbi:MAG TPA: phosphatase PAP2 family protein [Gammaproteobacteria bacterium]|nr:phosphatase PAP2 family protein [Gammaproteobacteria bacterium]
MPSFIRSISSLTHARAAVYAASSAAKRTALSRRGPHRTHAWGIVAALAIVSSAGAQTSGPGDRGDEAPAGLGADIKAYVTAPLHAHQPQWVRFGATLGALVAAREFDKDTRAHFVPESAPQTGDTDTHDGADALPAALILGGTWAAALASHDEDARTEASSMLEAAAFSSAAALVIKHAAGRARPFETADPDDWRQSGDSFPSMHTTAAFAIGTVLAESGDDHYRWLRRVLGYGVAAGTAYTRLDHDAHWLSDVVAGGALGLATARFVMKRRDLEPQRARHARLGIVPTDGGVEISYTVSLR